ncbi:histidine kinase [Neolewinella persica]|uniref:histidine kinase n=1 Tax=Neolewinella persica TaxID=70998 RepID=UPI00036089C9|nr:histidine kinase [Neolewinella persica]
MRTLIYLFLLLPLPVLAGALPATSVEDILVQYAAARTDTARYRVLKATIDYTATADPRLLLQELGARPQVQGEEGGASSSLLAFLRAEANYYANESDEALRWYATAIDRAEQRPLPDAILLSTLYAALAYVTEEVRGSLPAVRHYLKGLTYAEASGLPREIADVNYSLATTYATLNDFDDALRHARQSFAIDLESGDPANIATDLRFLADLSLKNQDLAGAERYANLALDRIPALTNQRLIGSLHRCRAEVFLARQRPDSALVYINRAIALEAQNHASDRLAANLLIRARAYAQLGEVDLVLHHLDQAEREAANRDQGKQLPGILLLRAELLQRSGRGVASMAAAGDARGLAREQKRPDLELQAISLLAQHHEAAGSLPLALHLRQRQIVLQDSIHHNITQAQLGIAAARFDVQRIGYEKQALQFDVDLLEEKISADRRARWLMVSIFLLALGLMTLFLYQRSRRNQLQRALHVQQLQIKDRNRMEAELQAIRSQLNPHFMFNSLNSINDFILRSKSDDASDYLIKFSKLMRLTLNHSKENAIPFREELAALRLYVELEALRFDNALQYRFELEDGLTANEDFHVAALVVQPFVENAIWHGLSHSKVERRLTVSFSRQGDVLHCRVEDNGIGREASARINAGRRHRSRGQSMIRNRLHLLEQLHGRRAHYRITDRLPQGTIVLLTLPILPAPKPDSHA